ncbi:outer membrane protein [Aquamicrobium zhengzhouense]|uniref:Porin family protein n=1 Tax=Aquamicrobium zhengzhouense TaxID=2781738 RepID=A0ABS0SIH4_9HYPH|nr:outer membrane protein [Aquamicrobium zhengzhouense]MBI1622328.1 porin family protein [Aquamicrobium zhengzhouense]
MRFCYKTLAACAALSLTAIPAFAADYDPPIYVEEVPEYVPVEIGNGWYLRGDVGYDFARPLYNWVGPYKVDNNRWSGSIGVGYHFSEHIRGDITASYLGKDDLNGRIFGTDYEASHTVWSGMVNGYLDIATVVGITPYIGAGVGFTHSRHKISLDPSFLGTVDLADRQFNFAYSLMAGASYKVTDNVSIDAGYTFLHTPKMDYLDTERLEIREGQQQHLLKVGLRYDLW